MSKLKATVENLASRIAATKRGRITPNDLLPYLPISLELLEDHLQDMVDGSVVIEGESGKFKTYEFPEFFDKADPNGKDGSCLACHTDLPDGDQPGLCSPCERALHEEMFDLAESTAWPAPAVKEHEIAFITSSVRGAITVAAVAGQSRMTLRRLKEELKRLAKKRYAHAVVDEERGVLSYEFPPIEYDKPRFQENDYFIRSHPSSVKDEVEVKIIKSLVALTVILVACIVLGFFHFPFPLVVLAGLVAAGLATVKIFVSKARVTPEQI